MKVEIRLDDQVAEDEVLLLYRANSWSSAEKPKQLLAALRHSDTLVTARSGGELIGLGNAISDGFLVVYYPHMLVMPACHGNGIGRKMMQAMQTKYAGIHQQMLTAESAAVGFYEAIGFERAGTTVPMWIYQGSGH